MSLNNNIQCSHKLGFSFISPSYRNNVSLQIEHPYGLTVQPDVPMRPRPTLLCKFLITPKL